MQILSIIIRDGVGLQYIFLCFRENLYCAVVLFEITVQVATERQGDAWRVGMGQGISICVGGCSLESI